jgi:hypothetical protein
MLSLPGSSGNRVLVQSFNLLQPSMLAVFFFLLVE